MVAVRLILTKFRQVTKKYPVARGMASYTVIWPVASLMQQKIVGQEVIDPVQALRFSIYGGFVVAPTLYCWLKCAAHFWPKSDLRSALTKALVEQVTYGPAAMCCFFFGINFLEFKPVSECIDQVKEKFWPTYKVGVCVWPVLQTINFLFVPEKNRVVYVSICSLMWTSFLAYMKSLESRREARNKKKEEEHKMIEAAPESITTPQITTSSDNKKDNKQSVQKMDKWWSSAMR